ncbi:NF-kappa-B essential modulator kenny isoform X2 [Anticarsia gemmatalis]|uniref:NF-kappa-B essential modulator kenny isoform X2 n=1 Tax=Anticarsia gemmatalis TaxID=129554 RepID=UPI003F76B903
MTTTQNSDDDSFIILGSSPGTSLDMKYNGVENGDVTIDKDQMEEAMKDLSVEASMALKAHFKLGEFPSPASMMVASTIISDDRTTEDLQKRFGELLDENVILKETLKQNNESMKEQFLLIASCQEDMMKTHELHKEKFDETKGLVEKLRQENKKLKLDIARLSDSGVETQSQPNSDANALESSKSGPSSALEFVTSPDDDTINKLTAQLELVEKQRRQVIVDNEKLTWQKESLEHIVDATSKERDDLKEKLKNAELQLSTKDTEHAAEVSNLKYTIQDLETQLQTNNVSSIPSEELAQRESHIQQLEVRVASLQTELKAAQLRILDLENVKLEFTKHKSGATEAVRIYKDQIQDLHNRLKEAATTVFQPVRLSISSEPESSSEYASFMSNVKLYDRTLKHLADLLNILTHGMSDSLVQTLGLVASLHDYKLDRTSAEQFKSGLADVKQQIEKQHSTALNNIGQVRSTLTIFEGIFRDYNELLKKSVSKPKLERSTANVEALTAALVARGQELQVLQEQLRGYRDDREDKDLMKAQLDLYKSDFEAEREAREKMASEKETILTDLRTTQRRNQELTKQLEEVRKLNPAVFQSAASRVSTPARAAPRAATTRPASTQPSTTGNMVFTCPKCMRFSCDQYKVMEDHFDFCLDDF